MQKWTVIISRKNITLSKWQIYLIFLPFIFLLGYSGWSSGNIINTIINNTNSALLSRQKSRFMKEILQIDRMLQSLERRYSKIIFHDEILRLGLDIPSQDEVRMLGTGGRYFPDESNTVLDRKVVLLRKKLDKMKIEQRIEERSLSDLEFNLLRSRDELEHTPSIMPTWGRITSGFGWRGDPFTGKRTFHNGIDVANKTGTPIVAAASGEVVYIGRMGRLGLCVKINHGYGYKSLYGHIKNSTVKVGEKVKRGNIIAYMGSSGRSTGTHLHYSIFKHGKAVNPRDHIMLGNIIY
ncbi:M23 family metallopeptidase [candidate division WOR-3 bacterium]|nr:M23 family metallopeptidase [candidate division WOR-3 bacterium]